MQTFLNDSDIAVLNAARTILARVSNDAMRLTFDIESGFEAAGVGRTAEAAAGAADGIFQFLNVASNYGKQPVRVRPARATEMYESSQSGTF